MANSKENEILTGLEHSTNFEQDERSLIASLLAAAEYKSSEEEVTQIKIKQNGVVLFTFRVRPLSQSEIQAASKKATKQIPNPAGSKYPSISGERNTTAYHNYLIYTATVEEDKKKIWGNEQLKAKYNIIDDADSVDLLLKAGDKSKVIDVILKRSGFDGEDIVDEKEYIKN